MQILTPEEKTFLEAFLYEATTAPFTGPSTEALHGIGVEYTDLPHLGWAYYQEVPMTSHQFGRASDVAPPLPWPDRETAMQRDRQIERMRAREGTKAQ